jgi:hypothetical protein
MNKLSLTILELLQCPRTCIVSVDSLLRYDGLEARQTSKPQNRRHLFDVELHLIVQKFFVTTSLNIIHRCCTFHPDYPYWTIT